MRLGEFELGDTNTLMIVVHVLHFDQKGYCTRVVTNSWELYLQLCHGTRQTQVFRAETGYTLNLVFICVILASHFHLVEF